MRPRRALAAFVFAAAAFAVTWNAQPLALASIRFYQRVVSPLAADAGIRCRFTPTCSRYAETAIARDGVWRGGWRALKRVARCTPMTPIGTIDEP
jgi:putative membrane protein insertion efficiency factor